MGHSSHAAHHHGPAPGRSRRLLLIALGLTLSYSGVEAAAGWWAGSLALLGDAGHMLTDSLALGLAAGAAALALKPPSRRHSYGYGRAENLAALLNALLMVLLVGIVTAEAIERLLEPQPVRGGAVTIVAVVGLIVNVIAAWLLAGGRDNLNVRAALIHVLGDLLGSVAALVSGVVIVYTGWTTIDPLLSIFIVLLILVSSLRILREALHTLMEGVPLHLDMDEIGRSLAEIPGVRAVHDLHIWSLSADRTALSAHLVVDDMAGWTPVLGQVAALLEERFGIQHTTLQPEPLEQRVPLDALRHHTQGQDRAGQGPGRGAGRAG
jgi:cobalt-zinc-cadmium efflux system protein